MRFPPGHLPLLLSTALLFAGCGRTDPEATTSESAADSTPSSPESRPLVRGVVQNVLAGRDSLMIKHEAIEGFMPAMTMAFAVPPEIINAAQPGQMISGELVLDGATPRLENVELGAVASESDPPETSSLSTEMGMGRGMMMGRGRGMMGRGMQTDSPAAAPADAQLNAGQSVYQRICIACHLPTGTGLPPLYPPLAGSEIVAGDPSRLARIVLHGLQGPLTVNDRNFNSVMPGQAANLSDADIAAALTYVRNTWGNSATPVTAETVAAERAAHAGRTASWTWAELNQ